MGDSEDGAFPAAFLRGLKPVVLVVFNSSSPMLTLDSNKG